MKEITKEIVNVTLLLDGLIRLVIKRLRNFLVYRRIIRTSRKCSSRTRFNNEITSH